MSEQPEELIIDGANVYEALCSNDIRNPDSSVPYDLETGYYDDEYPAPEPRADCACDNCFYNRDMLAMMIINLHEANVLLESELDQALEDVGHWDS